MSVSLPALSADKNLSPDRSSGTYLCLKLSKPQGTMWLEVLGKLKTSTVITGTQIHNLSARSRVPKPNILSYAPVKKEKKNIYIYIYISKSINL
jgi:hypothetical protein